MDQKLDIPEIYKLFSNICLPSKNSQIERIRNDMLNVLTTLQAEQDELLSTGLISKNGSLNFPPEILIEIFGKSDWNLQLRKLNQYFLDVCNQYSQYDLVIFNPETLLHQPT